MKKLFAVAGALVVAGPLVVSSASLAQEKLLPRVQGGITLGNQSVVLGFNDIEVCLGLGLDMTLNGRATAVTCIEHSAKMLYKIRNGEITQSKYSNTAPNRKKYAPASSIQSIFSIAGFFQRKRFGTLDACKTAGTDLEIFSRYPVTFSCIDTDSGDGLLVLAGGVIRKNLKDFARRYLNDPRRNI